MQQYFVDFFGGWSDEVSKKRFFTCVKQGVVQLYFINDNFVGYFAELKGVLEDVHVVDNYQSQGYGTRMLSHPSLQKELQVLVFATNPALRFYERNGFVRLSFDETSQSYRLHKTL
jgi:ribosomal protein S18 acetylase RimI-like enzyme